MCLFVQCMCVFFLLVCVKVQFRGRVTFKVVIKYVHFCVCLCPQGNVCGDSGGIQNYQLTHVNFILRYLIFVG